MNGGRARPLGLACALALSFALVAVIGVAAAGPLWVVVRACARVGATAASLPIVLAFGLAVSMWGLGVGHGLQHALAADRALRLAATRAVCPPARVLAVARVLGIRRLIVTNLPDRLAFCAGFLRPTVVVSSSLVASLGPGPLAAVLAHEAAHARNHDPLRQILGYMVARGLWVVPAARRGAEHLRLRFELEADRCAVAFAGRRALAEALLALHPEPRSLRSHAVSGSGSELTARIETLVDGSGPPSLRVERPLVVRSVFGLALASFVVVLAVTGPGIGPDPVLPMPMRAPDFLDMGMAWALRFAVGGLAWKATRFVLIGREGSGSARDVLRHVSGQARNRTRVFS